MMLFSPPVLGYELIPHRVYILYFLNMPSSLIGFAYDSLALVVRLGGQTVPALQTFHLYSYNSHTEPSGPSSFTAD